MVISLPDLMSIRLCLKRALQLAPDLDIVVRAPHKDAVEQLYQLGAREVVHPEFEASLEICSHILLGLGESRTDIQQEMITIRTSHYESLRSPHPSCLLRPLQSEIDPESILRVAPKDVRPAQLALELEDPEQDRHPEPDRSANADQQTETELEREVEAWYVS